MLHKAWNSKGEMPYCFSRSSVKFQGHTGQNISDFAPNWAFPDCRPVAAFKSLRFVFLFFQCQYMVGSSLHPHLLSQGLINVWSGQKQVVLVLSKPVTSPFYYCLLFMCFKGCLLNVMIMAATLIYEHICLKPFQITYCSKAIFFTHVKTSQLPWNVQNCEMIDH